jgi:hypothetical protein
VREIEKLNNSKEIEMKDFDGGSSEKAESGDYIAVFSFDPSSGKL